MFLLLLKKKTKFIIEARANLAGQAACAARTHKIGSWWGRPCCPIMSTFLATLWFGDSCGWMEEQMEKIKTTKKRKRRSGRMGRIWKERSRVERRTGFGLTCALFQLDVAAHMDVVYFDVSSGWMIKKALKHHLKDGEKKQNMKAVIKMFDYTWLVLLKISASLEVTPDTLWGFGAGWFVPPSSESLVPLSEPKAASPPAHCPSAAPSDCPAPPPEADSRRPDRGALAPAPPRGSGAALACAGCGRLRPGGGNSPKNLGREEQTRCIIPKHRGCKFPATYLASRALSIF